MDQALASEVFGKQWLPDVSIQPPHLPGTSAATPDHSTPSTNDRGARRAPGAAYRRP